MRKALRIWLAAVFLLLPLHAAAGDQPPISASDFQQHVYRGVTLDGASPKDAATFDALHGLGVNLVRVFLTLNRCTDCRQYRISPDGLADIDRVLALAAPRGIHVIVTMVPEPPRNAAYWRSAALQASIVDVWVALARRYKGNSAMAGFDLINEPNPPGGWRRASREYFDFASSIIAAVRAVDPERMIVFEPAPRGNAYYGFKGMARPLPYENVLYSPHFYNPVEFTHQGVRLHGSSLTPYGESYPNGRWNQTALSAYLDPVRKFAQQFGVPIYLGEFSAVRNAPNGSAYRWIRDVVELFEAERWSWTYHTFRGYQGWDAELAADIPAPNDRRTAARLRSADTVTMRLLRSYLARNEAGQ